MIAVIGMSALVAWSQAGIAAEPDRLVTLTVEERAGVNRKSEPVTAGVPLPRGVIGDPGSLTLLDERGRRIRTHIKAVTKWLQDGSVRWVHVHFQASLPASGKQVFTLARDGMNAAQATALTISDERDRITVITGPLKFAVRKSRFDGIDEAWIDNSGKGRFTQANRVLSSREGGLVMRASGREYRTSNDQNSQVGVEELTPLYVVIKANGTMIASDGGKGFSYICRLTAYADRPQVTVQVAVINTAGPRREDAVPLESLTWELAMIAESPRVLVGGESRIHSTSLKTGQTASIYQDSSDHYELGGVLNGSGQGRTTKPLTTGWAALSGGKQGVAAGVRWFWQLYPKAVEVTGHGKLRLDLYAGRAKPLDIYTGVSRTHDLLFYFHDGRTPTAELRDAFAAFQQPLRALAPLRWYCRDTKAFGNLVEADPALFGDRRQVLETYIKWWTANFDNVKQAREGRSIRGVFRDAYGWLEFGDGFHHVWQVGNSDPRNLAWDGNYYDFPHACLLHFVLTGRGDFFDFFIEHSRHLADVHFVHYDPNPLLIGSNRYCPPTDHVRMDPPGGAYRKAQVYVSNTFNHHKTLSLFENYLLTGDRRPLDVALMGLRFAHEYTNADSDYSQPRGPGNLILTLLAGYEFTGDRKYLDRCPRIIEFGRRAQAQNSGAFAPRSGQFFQVGITLEALIKYYEITNDETVIPMVKAAMDFFIAKKYSFSNCAYAAGFLYRKTGQREYLNYALEAVTKGGVFDNPVKNTGLSFRSTPHFFPYLATP